MIVSITCRHGTEINTSRSNVTRELLALSKYDPAITRGKVIFSKESHHNNADDLVTCHLSIYLPNKHQVDIYERQSSAMQAFDRAKARAIKRISRRTSTKFIAHKRHPAVLEMDTGV